MHAHRGGQSFAIEQHVVPSHFLDAQRVGRQRFIAVRIDGYPAGKNVRVPTADLQRHDDSQDQHGQSQTVARHEGEIGIAADQPSADQKVHHDGKEDRILHAEIGDKNETAGERAEDRPHGVGRIRAADAAAHSIKALRE